MHNEAGSVSSARTRYFVSILVFVISLGFQAAAYYTFVLVRANLVHENLLAVQLPYIFVSSGVVSVFAGTWSGSFIALLFLCVKFVLVFVATYATEAEIGIHMLLLMSLALEAAAWLPRRLVLFAGTFLVTSSVLLRGSVSAWDVETAGPEGHQLLLMLVVGMALLLMSFAVRKLLDALESQQRRAKWLDDSVAQLTNANVQFQDYAVRNAIVARENERRRISSDIHDLVGHSMTNIIVTLRLARRISHSDPDHADEALETALEQAQTALDETRNALRALRKVSVHGPLRGPNAIHQLAKNFEHVTGVKVSVDFANASWKSGSDVDDAIYHAVQEGLTNAFRHGHASEVTIVFGLSRRVLTLVITDNGRGVSDLKAGIGIQGLSERLDAVGGWVSARVLPVGFALRVSIPLGKEGG